MLEELAHGGVGAVHVGYNPNTRRLVASKTLFKDAAKNPRYVERFIWEGEIYSKLNHPNIVGHVDAGTFVWAQNRTKTIRAPADPTALHDDFLRPGHVQTLLADVGGVLRRAGHTEATTDLVRMAGRNPVGVLIEVLSERSSGMADRHELAELARQYEMPIVTIESLVRYRRAASSSDFCS